MYELEVECEYWLEQANISVQGYIEQSDYEFLFEANQATENNNNNVKNNTDTFIGNAARAVIKMIENIIVKIRNWLQNKFSKNHLNKLSEDLGKSGKGNTQIKTANTTKIKNNWNPIFKRLDNEVSKAKQEIEDTSNSTDDSGTSGESESNIINEIENMVKDQLGGLGNDLGDISQMGSAWVTTLTAEAALRVATTDAKSAEQILAVLENDKKLMEKLERDLGEARAKSYKKKIKSLTKGISLLRLRSKLIGQYTDSIYDAASSVIDDVQHIIQNGAGGVVKDHLKGFLSSGVSSEGSRKALRRADLTGKLRTNPNNAKGVKAAVRAGSEVYKQAEHARRLAGKSRPSKEDRKETRKKIFNTLLYGTNGKPE